MKASEILSVSKINLFLKITGKRTDGYHEIESVFLPLQNPADNVRLAPGENGKLELSASDPELPCDSRNLCWKAATGYAKSANLTPSWHIYVEKNIPVAAGMGGGSSNAASVLKLLQQEYQALSEEELFEIALNIGADVPFFLTPRPSLGKGIGELLTPISVAEKMPLLVVSPLFPVSTPWAYNNYYQKQNSNTKDITTMVRALETGNWRQGADNLYNDLAPDWQ